MTLLSDKPIVNALTPQVVAVAPMSVVREFILPVLVAPYGKLLLRVGVKDKALAPVVDLQSVGVEDLVVLAVAVD